MIIVAKIIKALFYVAVEAKLILAERLLRPSLPPHLVRFYLALRRP
jgi:hypothetical protein